MTTSLGICSVPTPAGGVGARLNTCVVPQLEAPTDGDANRLAPRAPLELTGKRRDDARVLVAQRTGQRLAEARIADLAGFLDPGDVLVVNTSATLPAAIEVDSELVVHLSTELEPALRPHSAHPEGSHVTTVWVVELRRRAGAGSTPWRGHRPSAPISLPGGAVLEVLGPYTPGGRSEAVDATRLWTARLAVPGRSIGAHLPPSGGPISQPGQDLRDSAGPQESAARDSLLDYLAHYGRPIRYGTDAQPWPLSAYQTVFAVEPGSAEMPSAGRGFTAELVTDLVRRGVTVAPIVLHTGVASQEAGEVPYPERYRVPAAAAAAVNAARASGRRVIAVGTTATRAIETVADRRGHVTPGEGWTDLVITPERGVRAISGLLTGWHDPEASHLMLVEAVAGREILDRSYEAAIAVGFAGHEFGDFHLILP